MNTILGYAKKKLTNAYVLTADGGDKQISTLDVNSAVALKRASDTTQTSLDNLTDSTSVKHYSFQGTVQAISASQIQGTVVTFPGVSYPLQLYIGKNMMYMRSKDASNNTAWSDWKPIMVGSGDEDCRSYLSKTMGSTQEITSRLVFNGNLYTNNVFVGYEEDTDNELTPYTAQAEGKKLYHNGSFYHEGGDFIVNSYASFVGTVEFEGSTIFNNALTINNTIHADDSNLYAGHVYTHALTVGGPGQNNIGSIYLYGSIHADASDIIANTLDLSGTLDVGGQSYFGGTLHADGQALTIRNINCSGTLRSDGDFYGKNMKPKVNLTSTLGCLAGTGQQGDHIWGALYVKTIHPYGEVCLNANTTFLNNQIRTYCLYNKDYTNLVLKADDTNKICGITFDLTTTNGSSNGAFIQYHAKGVIPNATLTNAPSAPTAQGVKYMDSLVIGLTDIRTFTSNGTVYNGNIYFQALNLFQQYGATAYKIWTEDNDGPNSGLDADTLDGVHASSFAPLSVGTNITAVTGTNSMGALPADKTFIYCSITQDATLGMSGSMTPGTCMTLLVKNNGSASITITFPSDGKWKSLDGDTLIIPAGKFMEISILKYNNMSHMISSKVQI